MKLSARELIYFAVMIGLLGCAYFFVFQKANARRGQLKSEISQRQEALTNLTLATTGVEDLNRKIDDLKKAIEFFESKLPAEREVDKILKEVWQMAEANSLQTQTVKTLKAERNANYSEQPIQMSLSGDFNGFYAFLLQLEKLPRLTKMTNMTLHKIDERDGEMQAQLTLSIFFEPDGQATASAE